MLQVFQELRRVADLIQAMYACLLLAVDCEGRAITIIEVVAYDDEALTPVQRAFIEADSFQCGFCTADQIKSLQGLLTTTPTRPTSEILRAVTGNLCRVMLPTSFYAILS